jgi:hypothetical protein
MPGLTLGGVDIHRTDRKILFDLMEGWIDTKPEVRGKDTIIPGKRGRMRQKRLGDRRVVIIEGYVQGLGVTVDDQRADYYTNLTTLTSLLDEEATSPTNLVVTSPYMGLPSGTATLPVYLVNIMPGDMIQLYFRRYSIEFESVTGTLDWTIA